jgi:hypothetical protein
MATELADATKRKVSVERPRERRASTHSRPAQSLTLLWGSAFPSPGLPSERHHSRRQSDLAMGATIIAIVLLPWGKESC